MALDYHETFERIVAKAHLLAQRYNLLLESRKKAQERIVQLEEQVAQQQKELQLLRQENEYLRMASVLAPKREQIEATRAMIAGLVREIDRCIADLTE